MTDTADLAETGTRDRILSAARNLLHREGYSAVGVAEICREAGVVKGSFYHFFPSKADLLSEVLRRNWRGANGALETLLESPGPARDRIARFFQIVVANARRMHREDGVIYGCNIGVLASELGPSLSEAEEELRGIFNQWRRHFAALIRAGQKDGSVSESCDPDATAAALLASIQGMSVLGRTLNDPDMIEAVANSALAQVPAGNH
ncbi:MAG: TetR/AcrR family transcriptional regulator [Xanthomonadales bacterium]|nr:TetR/AcrR family transcriptional regulator [Gammaproteobacteria bacterium]NNE05203.1 TetR/AcrR family transcriptional regulator [Xanthomonadales bacterium]NNL94363.1 TetR/AcrR family transcriptional regulator [Xanthomonadales bacterium]